MNFELEYIQHHPILSFKLFDTEIQLQLGYVQVIVNIGRWFKAHSDHIAFRGLGFAALWYRGLFRIGPGGLSNICPVLVRAQRSQELNLIASVGWALASNYLHRRGGRQTIDKT